MGTQFSVPTQKQNVKKKQKNNDHNLTDMQPIRRCAINMGRINCFWTNIQPIGEKNHRIKPAPFQINSLYGEKMLCEWIPVLWSEMVLLAMALHCMYSSILSSSTTYPVRSQGQAAVYTSFLGPYYQCYQSVMFIFYTELGVLVLNVLGNVKITQLLALCLPNVSLATVMCESFLHRVSDVDFSTQDNNQQRKSAIKASSTKQNVFLIFHVLCVE